MTEKFEFNQENQEKIKQILAKYPTEKKASAVMPLLDLAQRQNGGWVSMPVMHEIAKIIEVPEMRVYEVANFYSMYYTKPVGKYVVQVCGTTPCMLCGAEEILKTIEGELGIKLGQTTEDKMFTLLEVECLGACVNAPIVQINDDYLEDLSTDNIRQVIADLKAGKEIKVGSYKNRQCSKPLPLEEVMSEGGEK